MILQHSDVVEIKTQYDILMNNYVDKPKHFESNLYVTRLDDFDSTRIEYSRWGQYYYIKNCVWINYKGIPRKVGLIFGYHNGKLFTRFSY